MFDVGDPLVKESLVDEVAQRLRTLILTGKLSPGMRLHQEELSRGLGISRTPLRQALALLVEEGFVDRSVKGQYMVATMDVDGLLDLYRVRRELDGLAALLAAERRSASQVEEMGHTLHLMKEAEPHRWLVHHQQFHIQVYEASRNMYLHRHRHVILLTTRLFNPQLTASHTRRTESFAEQVEIWTAIAAGDGMAAKTQARTHITNAMAVVSPDSTV